MLFLIAESSPSPSPLPTLLMFALIGGVFYFLLIRPQQRRAKAQRALVAAAEVGDEIVTTAGMFGTITAVDDEDGSVTVEIAPGIQIRMLRAAIGRRLDDDDVAYENDEADEADEPLEES